jgi:hypothetical protein
MKNELVSVRPADPTKLRRSLAEQSILERFIRPAKRYSALPLEDWPYLRATLPEPV